MADMRLQNSIIVEMPFLEKFKPIKFYDVLKYIDQGITDQIEKLFIKYENIELEEAEKKV